jgi:hypothetical protein
LRQFRVGNLGVIWGHHGGNLGTPYIFIVAIMARRDYRRGMARLARVVVPGVPHHVTQRGNRRQETFFLESDYIAYLDLMAEWRGHLWQGRFASFPMDERHLMLAGRQRLRRQDRYDREPY